MLRLDGKRVAITGAAGVIGSGISARLRHAGAHVTAIDRIESRCNDTMIVSDLADPAMLARLAESLSADPPDILINVAALQCFGLHENHTAAALARLYAINLTCPAILAAAVAAPMRRRGSGQIVNIGSVAGAIPCPWFAAYSSSKAGLAALSQALRRELAGSGVCVTHISPRAARTGFNTTEADRFFEITGTKTDEPEWVADRIVDAILARRDDVTLGRAERFYAVLNSISPRLIDRRFAGRMRSARDKFS